MTDDISIRGGTLADLAQVIAIARHSQTAAQWSASDYASIFVSNRLLLVAEEHREVVGFIVGHDVAGEWELENVVVLPNHQHCGIGERLVRELTSTAKSRHAKFIFLEVRESNVAAKRLYQRCGFQQAGRRKSYYSSPEEDAILYRFLCNPETLKKC